MSVLTFLCFTSLICFALADPVPATAVSSPDVTEDVQSQVKAVVADIQKSIDIHLSCFFDKLDKHDRKYVDEMIAKACEEYINYAELLINQREKEISEWADDFDSAK